MGRGKAQGGHAEAQTVHIDLPREVAHCQTAALLQGDALQVEAERAAGVVRRGTGLEIKICEGNVIGIKALWLRRLIGEVVGEGGFCKEETAQTVIAGSRFEHDAAQGRFADVAGKAHGVAGHGKTEARVGNVGLVHVDAPPRRGGRGIFRRRVGKGNADICLSQAHLIQAHEFAGKVDAVRRGGQLPHPAPHVGVGNEVEGVYFSIVNLKAVHVDAPRKQRTQGHAEAQGAQVEHSVGGRGGKHIVHGEVERKSEAHALHADAHAEALGKAGGNLAHGKVLYGRNIDEYR